MFLKKEDLTNGAINFKYQGHIGPETKKKKAGGTYDVYTFQLFTTSDSKHHQYDIFKQSAEYGAEGTRLIDCQKGDYIQAYINGDWVNWKMLPKESEPSTIRSSASENTRQVKSEKGITDCWHCRTNKENCEKHKREEKIKERARCQARFAQAFINGNLDKVSLGDDKDMQDLINIAIAFGAKASAANRERALADILSEESQ